MPLPNGEQTGRERSNKALLSNRMNRVGKGAVTKELKRFRKVQIDTWAEFAEWIAEDGLVQFKAHMQTLDPKSYIIAYLQVLEYIKPKLSRATVDVNSTVDIGQVTFE